MIDLTSHENGIPPQGVPMQSEVPQQYIVYSPIKPRKPRKILRIILIAIGAIVTVGIASLTYLYVKATTNEPCTASETACSAAAALEMLPSNPGSLVPSDQKSSVDTSSAVPKGSIVKVYPDSWQQTGVNAGTMRMTLYSPWPIGNDYLVSMNKENGQWVVLITLPIQS
jgi:hypothetical protein